MIQPSNDDYDGDDEQKALALTFLQYYSPFLFSIRHKSRQETFMKDRQRHRDHASKFIRWQHHALRSWAIVLNINCKVYMYLNDKCHQLLRIHC